MVDLFEMQEYVPSMIRSTKKRKGHFREYPVHVDRMESHLQVSYDIPVSNGFHKNIGTRRISRRLPSHVRKDKDSFQMIGFLQGEMSKTHRGPITICNSNIDLMKQVIEWFDGEWSVEAKEWHWYVKLNIPEIENGECLDQLSSELIEYWLASGVAYEMRFPTTVSFIRNTANIIPSNEGTLIIEKRCPVFVQTLQRFIQNSYDIALKATQNHKIAFLQGLIAAECCINYAPASNHRRVFITSCDDQERQHTVSLLKQLGIESKNYPSVRATIVSGRNNLQRMHELNLVSLHPDKHKRFLEMLESYQR